MRHQNLEAEATRLLRKHGYTWAGRERREARQKAIDDAMRRDRVCLVGRMGRSRKGNK